MHGSGWLFLIAAGLGILIALWSLLIVVSLAVDGHLNIPLGMRWALGAVATVLGLTGSVGAFVVAWSEFLDVRPPGVGLASAWLFFVIAVGFFGFSVFSIYAAGLMTMTGAYLILAMALLTVARWNRQAH